MPINLFSLQPEGYKELTLPEGESFAERHCLRWAGESKISSWEAFDLVWLRDEFSDDSDFDADFIKFSGAIVVTERAYDVLADPLDEFVEFLPVHVDGDIRYILNVTNVLDILDKEKSKFKIYSDGEIGMCEHAYINEPDSGVLIYQVSGFLGRIFVSDEFNKQVNTHNLTGAVIREYKNP